MSDSTSTLTPSLHAPNFRLDLFSQTCTPPRDGVSIRFADLPSYELQTDYARYVNNMKGQDPAFDDFLKGEGANEIDRHHIIPVGVVRAHKNFFLKIGFNTDSAHNLVALPRTKQAQEKLKKYDRQHGKSQTRALHASQAKNPRQGEHHTYNENISCTIKAMADALETGQFSINDARHEVAAMVQNLRTQLLTRDTLVNKVAPPMVKIVKKSFVR